MDVASGEYGDVLAGLVSGVENGRLIYQETLTPTSATPSLSHGNDGLSKLLIRLFSCLLTREHSVDKIRDFTTRMRMSTCWMVTQRKSRKAARQKSV